MESAFDDPEPINAPKQGVEPKNLAEEMAMTQAKIMQLEEIFPNTDKDTIQMVLEMHEGNMKKT